MEIMTKHCWGSLFTGTPCRRDASSIAIDAESCTTTLRPSARHLANKVHRYITKIQTKAIKSTSPAASELSSLYCVAFSLEKTDNKQYSDDDDGCECLYTKTRGRQPTCLCLWMYTVKCGPLRIKFAKYAHLSSPPAAAARRCKPLVGFFTTL